MPSRLSAIIALTLFSFVNLSWAGNGPIPIKANENTTISIFFPSRIIKVVEPAAHFIFEYDVEGTLATLKAERGSPSNLTVITDTGDIYSFALDYSETIQEYTFVITPEQAIGRKEGMLVRSASAEHATDQENDTSQVPNHSASEENQHEEISFYDMDREGYYQIFCENSLLQRSITNRNISANSGVDLRLNHLAIDHDEIYFTLQFRNVSKSDYNIRGIRFYIKSPGSEELPMTPLYVHNLETYIKQSGVNKSVHVFKDFILGADQDVYAVMEEMDGNRHLVLPLNFAERLEDLED